MTKTCQCWQNKAARPRFTWLISQPFFGCEMLSLVSQSLCQPLKRLTIAQQSQHLNQPPHKEIQCKMKRPASVKLLNRAIDLDKKTGNPISLPPPLTFIWSFEFLKCFHSYCFDRLLFYQDFHVELAPGIDTPSPPLFVFIFYVRYVKMIDNWREMLQHWTLFSILISAMVGL